MKATTTQKNTKAVKSSKASTKSVTATPADDFNSSTAKSGRRQGLLKTVSVRLTNDPTASWSDVGTAFTKALLAEKWNDDLTEGGIIEIIDGVLRSFMDNNNGIMDRVIKSPTDVQAALKASRGKRGKK